MMKKKMIFISICILSFILSNPSLKKVDLEPTSTSIHVLVEGEVEHPGDYTMEVGTVEKLLEQVELTSKANCNCIDLNRELYDGDSIYIPSLEQESVSLNKASKEELMQIKGIGQKKAEAILAYREGHPFLSIEQIVEIKGIGQKTYLKWRPYLCL